MKQKVLFVLLNEYTDWEGAFLSTALHVGVIPGGEIKYEVHTVAPKSDAVRSIGGFRTLPDYSFESMPKDYAALVLIGGNRWDSSEAKLVAPLVQEALDKGKIVGAISQPAFPTESRPLPAVERETGNPTETGPPVTRPESSPAVQ